MNVTGHTAQATVSWQWRTKRPPASKMTYIVSGLALTLLTHPWLNERDFNDNDWITSQISTVSEHKCSNSFKLQPPCTNNVTTCKKRQLRDSDMSAPQWGGGGPRGVDEWKNRGGYGCRRPEFGTSIRCWYIRRPIELLARNSTDKNSVGFYRQKKCSNRGLLQILRHIQVSQFLNVKERFTDTVPQAASVVLLYVTYRAALIADS